MVKFAPLEVPPPGGGFVTNVPLRVVPPKLTNEAATKFVPLIVSVKATLPAKALFGEIVVIVGLGLRG